MMIIKILWSSVFDKNELEKLWRLIKLKNMKNKGKGKGKNKGKGIEQIIGSRKVKRKEEIF